MTTGVRTVPLKGVRGMIADAMVKSLATAAQLPHHGSARPEAYEFVRRVDPSVVLQSTGPSRLDAPRWDATRQGRRWLVTTRDGASRADLMRDGTVRAGPAR